MVSSLSFKKREKIVMVTCYDYTSARILSDTSVDWLLAGDSAAMTMHGFPTTLNADITMMQWHTAAVSRGAPEKFLIADLPFLSYRQSLDSSVQAVRVLMQAGAHAVKLEGAAGNLTLVEHLVESGVPVMGHLGLTPQFVHAFGGYKVQGKTDAEAERLLKDALLLQKAGCFAIVLECIPAKAAQTITEALDIPTIGIGAGAGTDGQVLVFQDLLGMNRDFQAKFVKRFVDGYALIQGGIEQYVSEVRRGEFPGNEHSY